MQQNQFGVDAHHAVLQSYSRVSRSSDGPLFSGLQSYGNEYGNTVNNPSWESDSFGEEKMKDNLDLRALASRSSPLRSVLKKSSKVGRLDSVNNSFGNLDEIDELESSTESLNKKVFYRSKDNISSPNRDINLRSIHHKEFRDSPVNFHSYSPDRHHGPELSPPNKDFTYGYGHDSSSSDIKMFVPSRNQQRMRERNLTDPAAAWPHSKSSFSPRQRDEIQGFLGSPVTEESYGDRLPYYQSRECSGYLAGSHSYQDLPVLSRAKSINSDNSLSTLAKKDYLSRSHWDLTAAGSSLPYSPPPKRKSALQRVNAIDSSLQDDFPVYHTVHSYSMSSQNQHLPLRHSTSSGGVKQKVGRQILKKSGINFQEDAYYTIQGPRDVTSHFQGADDLASSNLQYGFPARALSPNGNHLTVPGIPAAAGHAVVTQQQQLPPLDYHHHHHLNSSSSSNEDISKEFSRKWTTTKPGLMPPPFNTQQHHHQHYLQQQLQQNPQQQQQRFYFNYPYRPTHHSYSHYYHPGQYAGHSWNVSLIIFVC